MSENALFLIPALRRARDLIDRDYAEPLDLDAMERPYGIEALFRDDSGNWFSLTQPKWLG
jgi:hypothetical protein